MTKKEEIVKEKKPSLSQLVVNLKKVPFGCKDHRTIWEKVSYQISKKYPNQYVLCTPNRLGRAAHRNVSYRLPEADVVDGKELQDLFSGKKSLLSDHDFSFMPRENAEYNFAWKQINVFGFVTDGTKFILLQKTDKAANITMIGGHVDYEATAYNVSQWDWLRQSLQKEVDEEVKHKKELKVPKKPMALLNTANEFHDLFHAALVYKIEVKSVDDVFKRLTSGEPNKHNVIKVNSKDELLTHNKTHHWIKMIKDHL